MGCCCRRNITYGYELLVNSESSHNAFRLIMCCGIDMERLEGKQYIFSCKSNSGITIVCLSVYNHTWLSCLLAKMSFSIHAFMHAIWSAFVTSKPFWLVLIYLFCIGVVLDFPLISTWEGEPRELEYIRILVDASHWSGHQKLKKGWVYFS